MLEKERNRQRMSDIKNAKERQVVKSVILADLCIIVKSKEGQRRKTE